MSTATPRRMIWTALIAGVAVFALVMLAGLLIVAAPTWSENELQIVAWVHGASNTFLDVVAATINTVFGPRGAPLVGVIAVVCVLLLRRSWRAALRFAVMLAVPWAAAEVLKAIVQRPRPDLGLLQPLIVPDPATFSYPSGHTAFAAALCCAVLFLFVHRRPAPAVAAGALVVLLTAWSRVYLGVHYPTDVLASILVVPPIAFLALCLTSSAPWFGEVGRSNAQAENGAPGRNHYPETRPRAGS